MPTPSRYDKIKKENPLAADLAEDIVKEAAMARAPQAAFRSLAFVEKLRRLAQVGTVPGARETIAKAAPIAAAGSRFLGKLTSQPVGAAIEIGRGVNIAMTPPTEGSFDRMADAGDKLRTQPAWYQVGKSIVSTSDAFSQYGASADREAKKAFESKIAAEQGPAVDAYMAQQKERMAARENVVRSNEELRRSKPLFKDLRIKPPREDYTGGVQRVFPTKHPMSGDSNVKMAGVNMDGMERVIPTMVDGKQLTVKEAAAIAHKNGLDKYPSFKTVEEANAFAEKNHGSINEDGTLKKDKPLFPTSIREIRRSPLLKR